MHWCLHGPAGVPDGSVLLEPKPSPTSFIYENPWAHENTIEANADAGSPALFRFIEAFSVLASAYSFLPSGKPGIDWGKPADHKKAEIALRALSNGLAETAAHGTFLARIASGTPSRRPRS